MLSRQMLSRVRYPLKTARHPLLWRLPDCLQTVCRLSNSLETVILSGDCHRLSGKGQRLYGDCHIILSQYHETADRDYQQRYSRDCQKVAPETARHQRLLDVLGTAGCSRETDRDSLETATDSLETATDSLETARDYLDSGDCHRLSGDCDGLCRDCQRLPREWQRHTHISF